MKLYRAVVENNLDPEKIGRVQVRIYGIHSFERTIGLEGSDTSGLPWAEVIGGTEFGLIQGVGASSILRNGTLVWILFEEDDTNKPLVIGVVKGKLNGVSDINLGGNNSEGNESEYGKVSTIKSESGSLLEFDDTEGKERVTLLDKFGSFIEMIKNKVLASIKGNFHINSTGATQITATSGFKVNNKTVIDGDLYVSGKIISGDDVFSTKASLNTLTESYMAHTHTGNMGAPTSPYIEPYVNAPEGEITVEDI